VLIQSGTDGRHKRLCLTGISARLALERLISGGERGGSDT
jgi:hypothetical protein